MAPSNSQSAAIPIDLNVLQSQLNVWKAYERERREPYPFSPAIYAALSIVLLPSTEPDLDNRNYIGDLQELLQKESKVNLSKPEEEDMIEPSTGQKRFRVWYKIPDVMGRFPREGFGHGHGEAAPTFSQKKKAKQFAAKQAIAWLSGSSGSGSSSDSNVRDEAIKEEETGNDDYDRDFSMNESDNYNAKGKGKDRDESSRNGSYIRRPPSPQNPTGRKKIRVTDAEGQNGVPITPLSQASRVLEMPRSSNTHSNFNEDEDDETEGASLFKRIEKKCKFLGIDPPKYNIKPDEAGRWYGQPSCWADGRMPEDLGVVRDFPSKSQAKLDMAEQVLVWLVGEEKTRRKDAETILASRSTI